MTKLLAMLGLSDEASWDHFIYVIIKTGLRFAEALGLTAADIDVAKSTVSVSRTWDYKSAIPGFAPTKNQASVRTVAIGQDTIKLLSPLVRGRPDDQPIFVMPGHRVFNDTVNHHLQQLCTKAGIPPVTIHGLRHTHASILLYAGVSVASVARRLGHANMTTTQRTYLHIIQELEAQDDEKIAHCLSMLA